MKTINNKFKTLAATALLSAFLIVARAQQLPIYNQYSLNQTPLNSAYSLLDNNGSVNSLIRKQWTGIEGAPSTFIFSGYVPLNPIAASAGITVLDDKITIEHQSEINGFFAKSIRLSQNQYLGVSVNAGLRRFTANYSSLDATDFSFSNDVRETTANIGFGLMLYSDQYYLGFSVPDINLQSSTGSTDFRNRYNFSGALLLGSQNSEIRFKPATVVTLTRGQPLYGDFSMTAYFKSTIGIGVNYRTSNEAAGLFSVMYKSVIFGYSYEFGVNNNTFSGVHNGTQEVSLGYRFGKTADKAKLL